MVSSTDHPQTSLALLGHRVAELGLLLYVIFAPHSIAAAEISVAIAFLGWLVRALATGTTGLRRSGFDLVILLFLLWTAVSSFLSAEPSISILKLQSCWVVLLFYLTRATVTKRSAIVLVWVLILSGMAGAIYSVYDLVRGRGVVVESLQGNSPFRQVAVGPGDTIWRVDGRRVYSTTDIDEAIRTAQVERPISVSIISQGEHVERPGLVVTAAQQSQPLPAGVIGNARSHRFRASGWTRHYETFSELLQIVAQLALGLALANLRNHGANKYFKVAIVAASLLMLGITLTAMRTVLVAFVLGACLIAWRSARGITKVALTFAMFFVLAFGAVVVWQTRAEDALSFADPSASLRGQVARVGFSRILLHPLFGHGMDAMKKHWNEWGFPGKDMLHLHSTPLQLAFDRGLPALFLWLWLMFRFWRSIARTERRASDMSDTNTYGILLGALGALTGFFASSLVNYNYGDGEVALLFWWLMGIAVVLERSVQEQGQEDF
jgi:O-Antigen ligase/PDZ domain